MSQNDRIALAAGAVVAVTAVLSIFFDWGVVMVTSLLAGLLAVAAVIQPSLLASLRLSGSKGAYLLIAGVGATLVNGLTGIDYLNWIVDHIGTIDALQFIIGIVAAVVLLWTGWVAYRGEGGMAAMPPSGGMGATPGGEMPSGHDMGPGA